MHWLLFRMVKDVWSGNTKFIFTCIQCPPHSHLHYQQCWKIQFLAKLIPSIFLFPVQLHWSNKLEHFPANFVHDLPKVWNLLKKAEILEKKNSHNHFSIDYLICLSYFLLLSLISGEGAIWSPKCDIFLIFNGFVIN